MRADVIGVMVVDDHPSVLSGVKMMLETASDIRVVALAACADDAVAQLADGNVDVALVDISLPGENGMSLLRRIKRLHPAVNVIMLSAYSEEIYALRALKYGAQSYVSKSAPLDELLDAVRAVSRGGSHISAQLSDKVVHHYRGAVKTPTTHFTPREFEVLMKLVSGESITTIAAQINRSVKTVSTHKTRLLEKLNLRSVAELTHYAISEGFVGAEVLEKSNPKTKGVADGS